LRPRSIAENVKVYRGRLRPLDFYEVIWGYPVQDISLTLYDLWRLREFTDSRPHVYAPLRDAFVQGYATRPRRLRTWSPLVHAWDYQRSVVATPKWSEA
jgi:Ser/Thr protein kinase RdoA (MazF antagonist)